MQLGNVTLALDDTGSGTPVLLLHGFPSTRLLWQKVAPELAAAGLRVLAPDLAGYGDSTCPPPLEPEMAVQARLMLALLDQLGLSRVDLVAHDVGTAVAQIIAAEAADRVRKLVLIDGVHGSEWAMDSLAEIISWDVTQSARLHRLLSRRVRLSGRSGRLDDELIAPMMKAYEGAEGGMKLIRAARALHPEQTARLLPALRDSRIPALVLWGNHDQFLSPEAVGRPLAELLHAELVILEGGHFLPLERPLEVSLEISRFLQAQG